MKGKNVIVTASTMHQNGKSEVLLGPKTVNLKHWPPTDYVHHRYRNDVAFVTVGSLAKLLEHTYGLVVVQGTNPNGVVVIAGAVSTPQDIEGLAKIAQRREVELHTGRGLLMRRSVIHPNSPQVIARVLARGAYQGNGSSPKMALERLQTDTLLRADLDSFVEEEVESFARSRVAGFTAVYPKGFGGTYPWMEYVCAGLEASVK